MYKLLFFLVGILGLASCKKKENRNIKQITVSGVVYDSTSHSGMGGRLVKAYFRDEPNSFLATATTDTHGDFTMKVLLDIDVLDTQTVTITTDVPAGYMSIHDNTQPRVGFGVYDYVPEIANQKLVLFQEADLSITLQRIQTDLFTELETSYQYSEWSIYGIPSVQYGVTPPNPRIYHIKTAAGTYTKIVATKKLASGNTTVYKDSILCLPNVANSIVVNY